tara:strand:+ start:80931 stop:84635 length:3705 start_codon:yes stop_codon:yes gene_type:complete
MAQEAELRIKHDSVEKTTSAIDALISKLDQLDKNLEKVTKENTEQEKSSAKLNTALKAAEIARKKAVDMLGLHQQGLHKLSDAYATEQAAIKARETAAKKNIEVGSQEYDTLLKNIQATELATTASKRLAAEQAQKAAEMTKSQKAAELEALSQGKQTTAEKAQEKALASSNIARETSIKLLSLEEKGLDRLSDEYAEARGAILGEQQAKLKGIKTGSDEYNQLIKNTKAIEQSTAARKRLSSESVTGKKNASAFTNSLDDMARQAALVDGPLGGISSRLTTLSQILKTTGVGGAIALTALGVSVGILTQQLSAGVSAASQTEVTLKTLEAQVEATGFAAGYTAEQLDNMARSVAMSTLNSVDGVRQSITSLLAYTSVSGDIFEQAISKAEDIAILRKSGTSEVIKKLGKVLENPLARYKELVELGVEFDATQVDAIKRAQTQNDLYSAQEIIMDGVSAKFKDVAVAQADTLAGDVDTFSQKWDEYFEMLGKKGIPAFRSLTRLGSELLDQLVLIGETNIETSTRQFQEDLDASKRSVSDLEAVLVSLKNQQESMKDGSMNIVPEESMFKQADRGFANLIEQAKSLAVTYTSLGMVDYEIDPDTFDPAIQKEKELAEEIKITQAALDAKKKQSKATADQLTVDQKKSIDGLEGELEAQIKLTDLFTKYGDTRAQAYREEKAEYDALKKAKELGLEFDEEEVENLKRIYLGLSDLTEQRVVYNTILQKTKSLQSQQAGLEREMELYKATASGIRENSEEYIQLAASLKTANEVRQMGSNLSEEQIAKLNEENVALLRLQNSQRVLNALKAGDPNGANASTLDRQIELQKLLATGVRKSSSEYIFQEERLKALDTIRKNSVEVGSEEYKQLLKNAEAMAAQRTELQKFQDVADAGIVFNSSGQAQIEGSLKQLTSALPEELVKLDDLVDADSGISQEMVDKLKENLKETFQDERNEILIPMGFFVDAEGAVQAATDLNLIQEELRVQEKELKALWQEEDIISEEQYLERKRQLNVDYETQIADAKIAAWEKTAEAQQLTRSAEIAGLIGGGAEALAAVSNNSKKMAKIAKAAAIYQTSASLVQSIAKATEVGWPANIPLIAEAISTGATLVNQAKSLNEPSFAFGGVDIQGAGTGRSDSIKANIARGESVMTAPATARYKDTLQRMNAGLPVSSGGGGSFTSSPIINIQGDASERTVGLIESKLRDYENRVEQIAQGVSLQSIQQENEVGGFLNPI